VTKQEHELIFGLFALQMQLFGMIVEVLQSRDIVDPGDVSAFAALAMDQMRPHIGAFFEMYCSIAKQVGVELPPTFDPRA
jgi:hypothetical protein